MKNDSYYRFTRYTPDGEFDGVISINVTLHDESTLSEQLEAFERFLKACGYSINGVLEVVSAEST